MATFKVQKLVPNAVIPTRGTPGAAGYDLYSTDGFIIMPGHRVVIPTGLAIQLPVGTYGRIAPRSGLAVKHGVDVLAGVVDPDYTGELKVVLVNTDLRRAFMIRPGYRIAQLILENYTVAEVEETPYVEQTERGQEGCGSTGV
jgi:dUTP pyrophosphatase